MKLRKRTPEGAPGSKRRLILICLLAALLALLGIRVPSRFFTVYNFQSMAFQLPELGLLSLGMLVVVITGGIDLSLTYTASLAGIAGAMVLNTVNDAGGNTGFAILLCIVVTLFVSLVLGAFKGFFIAYLNVHPWLATLGTLSLFPGIGIILTKGGSISGFPDAFYEGIGDNRLLGIPLPFWILALVTLALGILLHRSAWGRRLFMMGSNRKVANYSGIAVRRMTFEAYILSSLIAGISGLIMISRYNSAKVDHGYTYLMETIAIIVLSGADINGGAADVRAMALTMILVQLLYTGVSMLGGNRYTVVILTGIILIGILLLNTVLDMQTKRREVAAMRREGN